MSLGPGKYDDLCTHVRKASDAEAVIVIVLNGTRGAGFSVQVAASDPLEFARKARVLADMLRHAADGIDEDAARAERGQYEGDATSGGPPGDAQKGPS